MTCTKWNKKRWRKQRLKMTAKVRVYSLLQFCVAEPQTLEEYSWSWGFVNLQLNELKPQATERHSILPKFKNPIKYDVKHNLCPRLFFFFICRKYLCKSWEGKERARKKEWDMIFYHTEAHFTWQIKKKKKKPWNLPHMESNPWLHISAAFGLHLQAVHVGGAAGASAQRGAW